ncbi:hypothetical protein [Asticcacaulis solisilvae]|uniref:hypothetical protein n=1 Tax=Asticcacaulis solisilvae TaxID=1217274 RepID=UPI003FD8BC1C
MSGRPFSLHPGSLALKIAVIVLTAALIAQCSTEYKAMTWVMGDARANVLKVFAFWLSSVLAPGFYLCALWDLGNVFKRMGRGEAFGPSMVRGLQSTGLCLMMGATAAVVLAPSFAKWLGDNLHGFSGLHLNLDIENVTIGLIGLTLHLLARRGAGVKAELEQFV